MSTQEARAALQQVVSGDARAVARLTTMSSSTVYAAAQGLGLLIGPAAVIAVLTQLASGAIKPDTAQRWGSFVMRGYLEDEDWPGDKHLFFEYTSAYDESIAEAVFRLEGIGDLVDGEVSAADCASLIHRLGRPDQPPARKD